MNFDRLVRNHKDAIYRQMVRACGNRDDAEDVLVEALLNAHRHSCQLRDEGAFRGWVVSIGRRVCYHLRQHASLREILVSDGLDVVPDPTDSAQIQLERQQLKDCIDGALTQLGPKYRSVYELRDIEGMSSEEVAASLGISIPAVKSRLHRARGMLRSLLDKSVCYEYSGKD